MTYLNGNDRLKSEKSRSWDIGAEYHWRNLECSLTYFDNHVKDMIDEVWIGPNAKEYQNINKTRLKGGRSGYNRKILKQNKLGNPLYTTRR